jgi:hypothetical protein
LQYLGQPKGERLKIAMEAIDGNIFVVQHGEEGRSLKTIRIPLDLECGRTERFIFRILI